jgi:hypothetical protein
MAPYTPYLDCRYRRMVTAHPNCFSPVKQPPVSGYTTGGSVSPGAGQDVKEKKHSYPTDNKESEKTKHAHMTMEINENTTETNTN